MVITPIEDAAHVLLAGLLLSLPGQALPGQTLPGQTKTSHQRQAQHRIAANTFHVLSPTKDSVYFAIGFLPKIKGL